MVVSSGDANPQTQAPAGDLLRYLTETAEELAALSLKAGAPQASVHFLRAALALQRRQPNAAPGDAA